MSKQLHHQHERDKSIWSVASETIQIDQEETSSVVDLFKFMRFGNMEESCSNITLFELSLTENLSFDSLFDISRQSDTIMCNISVRNKEHHKTNN